MARMRTTNFEELEDRYIGKIGTPKRDAYEADIKEAIQAYHVGEAIKAARKEKHLTQEQLAEMMGVKKAQVCRVERGQNSTLNTITRAFRALGVAVSLTFGDKQIVLG